MQSTDLLCGTLLKNLKLLTINVEYIYNINKWALQGDNNFLSCLDETMLSTFKQHKIR